MLKEKHIHQTENFSKQVALQNLHLSPFRENMGEESEHNVFLQVECRKWI